MAVEEFRSNKLRTFLSLFGVTIGIFCITSVLATIGSLEEAIQKDIKSLGSNTVYIDKWEYKDGTDFPWGRYINSPTPTISAFELSRKKVPTTQHIAVRAVMKDKDDIEY